MTARAPSGARLAGDDFQCIVAATTALVALHSPRRLRRFAIEAKDQGPIDDVVAEFELPPSEYVQVKFAVDASRPLTSASLREPSPTGGPSLLRGMFERWRELRERDRVRVRLVTARQIDPADPFLMLRDTRSERLVPFAFASEKTAVRAEREEWLTHLGTDALTLERFLHDLEISSGRSEKAELDMLVGRMLVHGLRTDEMAMHTLIGAVRNWIKGARPVFERAELAAAIDEIGLGARRSAVHVSFSVLSEDASAPTADVNRSVTDVFDAGVDPMMRRAPREPTAWLEVVQPAFATASEEVRAMGESRVLITGDMRLAGWFLAGAQFRDVAGYSVICGRAGQPWDSGAADGRVDPLGEDETPAHTGGADLAVAVGITHPIADDVRAYVMARLPSVGRVLVLSARDPSQKAVRDGPHAAAVAIAVQRQVQRAISRTPCERLHVFLAGPAGLALLLGNRWNRLRPSIVYEDLGAGLGYAATFEVAA